MTTKRVKLAAVAGALVALALALPAAGCKVKGPSAAHQRVVAGTEPLRTAFNADVDKARVLMLAAPT